MCLELCLLDWCQNSKNATQWPSVTSHSASGDVTNWREHPAMTFSAISFGKKRQKKQKWKEREFFPLNCWCLRVFPQLLTNWPSSASTVVIRTQTQTHSHSVSSLTSLNVPALSFPASSPDCRDSVKSSLPFSFTPPSILIFTLPTLSFCLSSLRQSSVAPLLWQLLIQSSHTPLISHTHPHSHILSFLLRAVGQ